MKYVMADMLEIDGSQGEGGGQILRTSLTLSLTTGCPVRVFNIRAGRRKPGLLRQHLTALQAAAEIGNAETRGAELHSRDVTFIPQDVVAGTYHFAVGTAGSAMLVLQTVLPALLRASESSSLTIEGGTHNPFAPPFEFIERCLLPLLNRIGSQVSATLDRPGFYPAGGGRASVVIEPATVKQEQKLELLERGDLVALRATSVVSRLPRHIAEREVATLAQRLDLRDDQTTIVEETRAIGPGNVVSVEVESANVTERFTGFGKQGVSGERVAAGVAREVTAYLAADVPVGSHLADQLLLPLALVAGGCYRTCEPTPHTLTNIDVIQRFLDVEITVRQETDAVWRIDVGC
jgi:RNA 3'-terminal phosphate cyclase (ATP)